VRLHGTAVCDNRRPAEDMAFGVLSSLRCLHLTGIRLLQGRPLPYRRHAVGDPKCPAGHLGSLTAYSWFCDVGLFFLLVPERLGQWQCRTRSVYHLEADTVAEEDCSAQADPSELIEGDSLPHVWCGDHF
jgi:hypothetical protein